MYVGGCLEGEWRGALRSWGFERFALLCLYDDVMDVFGAALNA